ncbi:carboxypeptidase-like regulatory domain-containing protein [Rubinisphaera margarita]|uniref:carboxypeptidase-like regulatory domain-containing protein n=1 Tax=Rubinisphaera margarita TaxID=2909586 RepID=UPI001EE9593A|nr:carboxypeptidase-like regulatory domain-containing protein [Rubinisphaera margarita]MCG6155344.1 carboxypeptidase-like regulatory domain-containing protein [Rubinisphaera margarita]
MTQRSATFYFVYVPILFLITVLLGLLIWVVVGNRRMPVVLHEEPAAVPTEVFYQEGKGRLQGRIVRKDGSPNTEPVFLSYDAERRTGEGRSVSMGSMGRCTDEFDEEIPSGETWILVSGDSIAQTSIGPLENHAGGVISDLTIVVDDGEPLDLVLRGPNGNPVIGANVEILLKVVENGAFGTRQTATEQGKGRYRFPHVSDATYFITIEAPGFAPFKAELEQAGAQGEHELSLQPTPSTTGQVLTFDGKPIGGARFILNCSTGNCGKVIGQADENGHFDLNQLDPAETYEGYIEGPDGDRMTFLELKAGHTGLVYQMPRRRTLRGLIHGDLSQLRRSFSLEERKHYPSVVVVQRYKVRPEERGGHYLSFRPEVKITDDVGHFELPGIFADDVEVRIGPYSVILDPEIATADGDILLGYDLDSGQSKVTIVDWESKP